MRSSAVIGLTALTLASAADPSDDMFANVPCFENNGGCLVEDQLTRKCASPELSAEESVECACNDYFNAYHECTQCLGDLTEQGDMEAVAEYFHGLLEGGIEMVEKLEEVNQRHKAKLCQQKEVKLDFNEALREVTDDIAEEGYMYDNEKTATVPPPASTDATASPASTPADDDQDKNEDGSKGDEDDEDQPGESAAAISMASAGIMALAGGSALLAFF